MVRVCYKNILWCSVGLLTSSPSEIIKNILQRVRAGEVLMCFLCKIAILKCFFFNLLLRFFVGALGDWRQAICRHYFSASAFLHWLIQFMIFHTASFSVMCLLPPARFWKRREVLFWVPSPYPPSPPSPWMFCLISRLLLKLAFWNLACAIYAKTILLKCF